MSFQRESFSVCIACHSIYPADLRECQRKGCIDDDWRPVRLWLVTPYPALAGFRKWWPPDMRDCAPAKYQHSDRDDELMLLEDRIGLMRGALIEMLRQNVPAAEMEQAQTELRAMLYRRDTLRAELDAAERASWQGVARAESTGRHQRSHRSFSDNGNSAVAGPSNAG